MEDRQDTNSHGKTRRHNPTWSGTLLPQSGWLAAVMDGVGRGSAARRTTADDLPSIPGTPSDLEPDTEDDSTTRGQPVGAGRGVHPGPPLRPATEKEAGETGAPQNDRIRRAAAVSRRGGGAKLLRCDVPKVQEIPRRDGLLTPPDTHKFRRRGLFTGALQELTSLM